TADISNEAAFAQFAALDKTAASRCAADLLPEAEHLAGFRLGSVDRPQSEAQVVNFAGGQRMFLDTGEPNPQRRGNPRSDRGSAHAGSRRKSPCPLPSLRLNRDSPQTEQRCLGCE